jgi:hypothetical protein
VVRTDSPGLDLIAHLVEIGQMAVDNPVISVLALSVQGQLLLELDEQLEKLHEVVLQVTIGPASPNPGKMLVGKPSVHRRRVGNLAGFLEDERFGAPRLGMAALQPGNGGPATQGG